MLLVFLWTLWMSKSIFLSKGKPKGLASSGTLGSLCPQILSTKIKMCLFYNFSHVLDAVASFSYILFHIGDDCDQFKMGTTSLNRQRPVNNFSLILICFLATVHHGIEQFRNTLAIKDCGAVRTKSVGRFSISCLPASRCLPSCDVSD